MKFSALMLDGRHLTEADVPSVALLPLNEVVEVSVQSGEFPVVTLRPDLDAGERVHFFVRHCVPVGNPEIPKLSVPVYEIRKDEKTLCRLYWHPEKGPLLTSQDLYF